MSTFKSQVLAALASKAGQTATEVGAKIGAGAESVSKILTQLHKEGLATRENDLASRKLLYTAAEGATVGEEEVKEAEKPASKPAKEVKPAEFNSTTEEEEQAEATEGEEAETEAPAKAKKGKAEVASKAKAGKKASPKPKKEEKEEAKEEKAPAKEKEAKAKEAKPAKEVKPAKTGDFKFPEKKYIGKDGSIDYKAMGALERGTTVTTNMKKGEDDVTAVILFADWDKWQGKMYYRIYNPKEDTAHWKSSEKVQVAKKQLQAKEIKTILEEQPNAVETEKRKAEALAYKTAK